MIFIESTVFMKRVGRYLSDDDVSMLQAVLVANPKKGSVIPRSGGLRREIGKMEDQAFQELLDAVHEMKSIQRGEKEPARLSVVNEPDVAELRHRIGVSQSEFATLLGISVRTLQEWEQGRRKPRGPARVLLHVAASNPRAIVKALHPTVDFRMAEGRTVAATRKKKVKAKARTAK